MPSHDVSPLQTALNLQQGDTLTVDGVFGSATRAAMQAYQQINDLTVSDQPTREVCASLGITLAADFPYQPTTKGTIMSGILGSIFSGLFGNLLNWQLVQGYIRSGLVALGGWIGLDGYVGHDGTTSIIGAIMVILGVVFQALSNNRKVQALAVVKAVDQHPDITVVPAADTSLGKPIVSVAK